MLSRWRTFFISSRLPHYPFRLGQTDPFALLLPSASLHSVTSVADASSTHFLLSQLLKVAGDQESCEKSPLSEHSCWWVPGSEALHFKLLSPHQIDHMAREEFPLPVPLPPASLYNFGVATQKLQCALSIPQTAALFVALKTFSSCFYLQSLMAIIRADSLLPFPTGDCAFPQFQFPVVVIELRLFFSPDKLQFHSLPLHCIFPRLPEPL